MAGHSVRPGGSLPDWIARNVQMPALPGGLHGLARFLTLLAPFLEPHLRSRQNLYIHLVCASDGHTGCQNAKNDPQQVSDDYGKL